MKRDHAAQWASDAADDAVHAATIAKQQADKARRGRQGSGRPLPVRAHADGARARIAGAGIAPSGRTPAEPLARPSRIRRGARGLEERRAALSEEVSALRLQAQDEPARHTTALAARLDAGETGERPASRLPELEQAIMDRQAELDAVGIQYDQLLRRRAEHVASNRKRLLRDVHKAKRKAAAEYASLVDRLEATRRNCSTCARPRCGPGCSRPST